MGEIAARLADLAIVTSDNPRSEDPEAIVEEVAAGAAAAHVEREVDRRAAIARAVGLARPGDIVVIAGKGHEQGQEFEGGRKEPFDDVTVAREALQAAACGARVRHWSVQRIAGTVGAQLVREQAGGRAAGGPGARGDRLARASSPATSSSACRASTSTAARSRSPRSRPARGASWSSRSGSTSCSRAAFEGAVIASEMPVPALRRARARLAAGPRRLRDRGHRLGRQDLDQGPDRRDDHAAPQGRRLARELQHRDRAAAGGARGAVRHRGAGARAGDARPRPDRRAGGDLRARRRRDHEHRPRPPRAARLARGRRARPRPSCSTGMAAGCTGVVPSDEPLLEPWLRDDLEIVTFGPGGDVHFEGSSLKCGVVPDALPTQHVVIARGERIELELPFDQEHNMLNALAAVAAARAIGVHAERRDRRPLLLDAGRARGARDRGPRHQRLLQRQPAFHARRPGRSRLAPRRGPPRGGPRRHARTRPRRARAPPRDRRLRGVGRGRPARDRRARAPPPCSTPSTASRTRCSTPPRPPRCCPSSCVAGDVVLVKASRGVGLEVVTEALQAAG